MEINIGEKYKITADTFNVIVNQRFNKKVKEGAEPVFDYKPVSFHLTLEKACISLLNRELRENESKSIAELILVIQKAKTDICEAVSKEGSVQIEFSPVQI